LRFRPPFGTPPARPPLCSWRDPEAFFGTNFVPHAPRHTQTPRMFTLPEDLHLIYINIGANLSPIRPPAANSSVAVVAFEPIVFNAIQPMPRLYIVPCAVSGEAGVATMGVYNRMGVSSSLSSPVTGVSFGGGAGWAAEPAPRNAKGAKFIIKRPAGAIATPTKEDGERSAGLPAERLVPVISLAHVLHSLIGENGKRRIWFLKTDMWAPHCQHSLSILTQTHPLLCLRDHAEPITRG
jgi:hypothetical protein